MTLITAYLRTVSSFSMQEQDLHDSGDLSILIMQGVDMQFHLAIIIASYDVLGD